MGGGGGAGQRLPDSQVRLGGQAASGLEDHVGEREGEAVCALRRSPGFISCRPLS